MNKEKIIVLAGNRRQFEKYLDENGLTDSEAMFGWNPCILQGVKAKKIEIIGTFWEREDAGKLKELADSRLI